MITQSFFRFSLLLLVLIFVGCTDNGDSDSVNDSNPRLGADSLTEEKKLVLEATRKSDTAKHSADSLKSAIPRISYSLFAVSNAKALDSIRRTYAKTKANWLAYRAFTTINRKDIHYVRIGDSVLIPDSISSDLRWYSVFPYYYQAAASIPKLLVISNEWQSYACYEYGKLVRFAATNTGEERKPTFPGRYAVNWKQRLRLSSLDSTWVLPFTVNIHQYAGSAMHQFDMPGRPVSHSCVRQFLEDAEWIYNWVKVAQLDSNRRIIPFTGTPVIIHGLFDFSRKRGGPWLDLKDNSIQIADLPKQPMDVEPALIPISQIPKAVRGALVDGDRYREAEGILRTRGWIRDHVQLRESIDYNKLRREKKRRQEAAAADSLRSGGPAMPQQVISPEAH